METRSIVLVATASIVAYIMRQSLLGPGPFFPVPVHPAYILELTHDVNALVPLLLASMAPHAFTVLALPRSILAEKIARRGVHLSREYGVDPLEIILVRDVMDEAPPGSGAAPTIQIGSNAPLRVAVYRMAKTGATMLTVVDSDEENRIIGYLTVEHLLKARAANLDAENRRERHLRLWVPSET